MILARAITTKKPFLPVMSHRALKPGCRWVVLKPFDYEKPLSEAGRIQTRVLCQQCTAVNIKNNTGHIAVIHSKDNCGGHFFW